MVMLKATVGFGAHQQDGWCPMLKLPDCCKKARSNEPGASIARVCCNLNCSEPGSTGNGGSSSFSPQQSTTANTAFAISAVAFSFRIVLPRQPQQFHLSDSNPKYI